MASAQSPAGANLARSAENGLGRLAAWCYDHRCRVLAGWLLAVVAIIRLAQWAGSRLDDNFALASSPSQQGPLAPGRSSPGHFRPCLPSHRRRRTDRRGGQQ
jgi:hypothetical protein